jgi:hypothetical protein
MLGIAPPPEAAAAPAPQVYSAPLPGAVLAVLGIAALVLLALMPATLGVGWLPAVLFGLPLALGGACGALVGYAVASTRIEVAPDGIAIAVPGWRGCPFPPVRQYRLGWQDVRAVRHRTECYRLGRLPLRLPFEVYAIETADGIIPFGSYYLSDLEPVLIEIAHRADRLWREDDEVYADLLRTLLHGIPPWPPLDRRPRDPQASVRSFRGSNDAPDL